MPSIESFLLKSSSLKDARYRKQQFPEASPHDGRYTAFPPYIAAPMVRTRSVEGNG